MESNDARRRCEKKNNDRRRVKMFKITDERIPTLRSDPQEWADYAEFLAIRQGEVSFHNVIREPSLISDEIDIEGIEDDSTRFIDKIDEIANEIRNRIKFSNNNYPFSLSNNDYTLQYNFTDIYSDWIYKFLLYCTRLNMKSDREHNGLDGTLLFEKLSAEIAKEFFGKNAKAEIFGTSNEDGLRQKLEKFIKHTGEGGSVHQNTNHKPKDDNIDIVVWKGFSDKRVSQVLGFGQCKTGTSWQHSLSELNTETVCDVWFSRQPVVSPLKLFFCAQYFPNEIWYIRTKEAGLVFDRFRMLDYHPQTIDEDVFEQIKNWCKGVEFKHFDQAQS